ncbi:MAG: hypothetical protein MI974_07680 [Chitinophagales bacterium]|nr:hypothetical protein [Chitinophagales bacterium]
MEHHLTNALLETIDRYIKGELVEEELLAFEAKMKENAALKEEVLIQQQLFNTLNDKTTEWALYKEDPNNKLQQELKQKLNTPEYQSISEKIQHIGQEYIQELPPKKNLSIRYKRFISAAAVVLFLIVAGISYTIINNQSVDRFYYEYAQWETELPSFVEKNATESTFAEAEASFRNKEYIKAIQLFESIEEDNELYPYSLLYIGASYASSNKDLQALKAFNQLAQMDAFAESSKGLWYATLIHLKQGDKDKAVDLLNIIIKDSNNYHYNQAIQLLEQL